MPETIKMAFERQVVVLPLSNILPIKRLPDTVKQAMRYAAAPDFWTAG